MGKKKSKAQYTSKGERKGVAKKYQAKNDISQPVESFYANVRRFDAYISGRKAYITIPNPNPNNTKERWIKVNAKDHFNNTIGTELEGKKYKDKFLANRHFRMTDRPEIVE